MPQCPQGLVPGPTTDTNIVAAKTETSEQTLAPTSQQACKS